MKNRPAPRPIRIFLSSPGDVADERGIALNVIRNLPHESPYRERIHLIPVAWDDPGSRTPMLATLTPQEAINRRLPKPSECDIVVVILWSRMGTPLPFPDYRKSNGEPYFSGTEWEYLDAEQAAREHSHGLPLIVVYRRTEKVMIPIDDPDFDAKREQYERVNKFFERFSDPSGSITGGINPYATPEDFRQAFQNDLRELVDTLLELPRSSIPNEARSEQSDEDVWPRGKSPFPGLRALTPADAPIFFGRGRETDALIEKVRNNRFVAVVGASGSGKSSLVGAGLIPRLKGNAVSGEDIGSKDWHVVTFTPATAKGDPFRAMTEALVQTFPSMIPRPLEARRLKDEFVAALHNDPASLVDTCKAALAGQAAWSEVLLFVDQFEELFTLVPESLRTPFVELLAAAATSGKIRTVVTMRADFYHACLEFKPLEELLRAGTFPLGAPTQIALYDMITRPATRARLAFEDGLPERILEDTGNEPGALALMAYTLDELFRACKSDGSGMLSHAVYHSLGGVTRAIGTRAENAFAILPGDDATKERTLRRVFHALVKVDERGTATRRRAAKARLLEIDGAAELIDHFASEDVRLLVTSGDDNLIAEIEVAHEALFHSWPRLAEWITAMRGDLFLLEELRKAARVWDEHNRHRDYLWPGERGQEVQRMLDRLNPDLDDVERAFARPEHDHLLDEIADIDTLHPRRSEISTRLHQLNHTLPGAGLRADGLPDIEWCYVDVREGLRSKKIEFVGDEGKFGEFEIEPFDIAKYLVTYVQFEAFVKGDYGNPEWWRDMPKPHQRQEVNKSSQPYINYPRDTVSWYQAVAFCRWLSADLNYEVTLPTEHQWQWAAQNGLKHREYPWGGWDGRRCNTSESGVGRTTAVGMYPHGAAACGALDMSGNLLEWCLNKYDKSDVWSIDDSDAPRVVRGGSWGLNQRYARAAVRLRIDPDGRYDNFGFRVVRVPHL